MPPKPNITPVEFRKLNLRRLALIRCKSLSPAQKEELAELQKQADRYVDAKYPIDFGPLRRLETGARRASATRKN